MSTPPSLRADPQAAIIGAYLKQLKLPAIAHEYQTLARDRVMLSGRAAATSAISRHSSRMRSPSARSARSCGG